MPRVRDDSKIDAIFNATLKLVLKTGFNGLKMADVAKAAKVATGTLYIYFKNKEQLINQLYLEIKTAKMKKLMQAYDARKPYAAVFKDLWLEYLHISLQEPEKMIFIEQFTHSSYLSGQVKKQADKLLASLEQFIQEGIKSKLVKELPVQLILGQLLGPINEMVKLHHDQRIKMTASLQQRAFEMAWQSVKA